LGLSAFLYNSELLVSDFPIDLSEWENIAEIFCDLDKILCAAVKMPEPDLRLDGSGPGTCFAPTDDGFHKFFDPPCKALEA
jgi:hypothetical protein